MVALTVVGFPLAPPDLIKECSDPEYRQDNLDTCNIVSSNPGGGPGAGRGSSGGLLDRILDAIGLGGLSRGLI